MKIEKIRSNTTEPQPHVIPEVEKTPKSDIRLKITSTKQYNTRSITNKIKYVTTFKNAPNMFKMDATEK